MSSVSKYIYYSLLLSRGGKVYFYGQQSILRPLESISVRHVEFRILGEALLMVFRVDYFCSLIDLLGILNPTSSVFYIILNDSVISSDLEN